MFFHDKPAWGIALRVILVLILIGGAVLAVRSAFYRGYAVGVGTAGSGSPFFFRDGNQLDFHHQDELMPGHMDPDDMFYYHQGSWMGPQAYPGMMGYPSRGGFWSGGLHILLGMLGFFLLAKLILGFGYRSWYWGGMMARDPEGKYYHHPHFYHHRCGCPCCSGNDPEEKVQEAPAEEKPAKKTGRAGK